MKQTSRRCRSKAGTGASAGVVTIGDVATVRRAAAPTWTKVTSDGTDAVLVNVRQTPTADAVSLVKQIDERLKSAALPSGVRVAFFYDQSELVTGAANSVRDAILLGALLAGVVLFLFLRSWRLMVITALLLPAVLAATCLALYALGMSFNMMTLGGMAASVGLVVDDAVVMLEHLMRRLQEAEHRPRSASGHRCSAAALEMAQAAVRLDPCDDGRVHSARVHQRRDGRLLQSARNNNGRSPRRIAALCPLCPSAHRRPLADAEGCRCCGPRGKLLGAIKRRYARLAEPFTGAAGTFAGRSGRPCLSSSATCRGRTFNRASCRRWTKAVSSSTTRQSRAPR